MPPDTKQEEEDIKQEEEDIKQEEEEESITRRGDLLDFTDQDHTSEMEQNQNLEQCTDDTIKREEPDSPSATTDKQVSVHDVMIKPAS